MGQIKKFTVAAASPLCLCFSFPSRCIQEILALGVYRVCYHDHTHC